MGEIKKSIILSWKSKRVKVSALLDSGATTSVVDSHIAKRLNLPLGGIVEGELMNGKRIRGYETLVLSHIRVIKTHCPVSGHIYNLT